MKFYFTLYTEDIIYKQRFGDIMELPFKTIIVIAISVIILIAIVILFTTASKTEDIKARNIFEQGCLKYCDEISRSNDIITEAINKSEAIEGTDFIRACKQLYPDVKKNWQCWNRDCCKFSVYKPL